MELRYNPDLDKIFFSPCDTQKIVAGKTAIQSQPIDPINPAAWELSWSGDFSRTDAIARGFGRCVDAIIDSVIAAVKWIYDGIVTDAMIETDPMPCWRDRDGKRIY